MSYSNSDFQQTLGREIGTAFEGTVAFEDLSISECLQVLLDRYGESFDIDTIRDISDEQLDSVASDFNEYFEVSGITRDMVSSAFEEAIRHWS